MFTAENKVLYVCLQPGKYSWEIILKPPRSSAEEEIRETTLPVGSTV